MDYKTCVKGDQMKNNRRAYLCCNDKTEGFYKELWDKRLGEYITRVKSIDDATGVYVIDKDSINKDKLNKVLEEAQMKGIRVWNLNKELVDEELIDALYKDKLNSRIKGANIEIER